MDVLESFEALHPIVRAMLVGQGQEIKVRRIPISLLGARHGEARQTRYPC